MNEDLELLISFIFETQYLIVEAQAAQDDGNFVLARNMARCAVLTRDETQVYMAHEAGII